MPSIGSAALYLTTNSAQLLSGLDRAKQAVTAWAASTQSIMGRVFGTLLNPLGAIESHLSGVFDAILGDDSQFTKIKNIDKLADTLGLSTEALTGFQYAAKRSGIEVETFNTSLKFMERGIGKAQLAAETSHATLEKFGIDVEELAKLTTEDQILTLSERFKQIESPVEKAAFAVAAFGKKGQELQRFLDQGVDGLTALRAEAELLGQSFSREQGGGAEAARNAVGRIQDAFDGLKRQLAIAFAPVIEDIGRGIFDWVKDIGGVKNVAREIVGVFVSVGETILTIVETMMTFIESLVEARKFLAGFVDTLKEASGHIGSALDISVKSGIGDKLKAMREEIEATTGQKIEIQAEPGPLQRLRDTLDKVKNSLDQVGKAVEKDPALLRAEQQRLKVFELTNALQDEIRVLGMDKDAQEIEKLQHIGVSEAMLAEVRALMNLKEAWADNVKLWEGGKKLTEEMRDPFQKFADTMDELGRMLDAGAINWETYQRAAGKAGEELDKFAASQTALKSPQALIEGSREATSAIIQAGVNAQNNAAVGPDALKKIAAAQLAVQQKQAATADQLLNIVKQNAAAFGVLQ